LESAQSSFFVFSLLEYRAGAQGAWADEGNRIVGCAVERHTVKDGLIRSSKPIGSVKELSNLKKPHHKLDIDELIHRCREILPHDNVCC